MTIKIILFYIFAKSDSYYFWYDTDYGYCFSQFWATWKPSHTFTYVHAACGGRMQHKVTAFNADMFLTAEDPSYCRLTRYLAL